MRAQQPVIYLVEPFGGSLRRQNANLPHVYWDDAAVTRGDGCFETILIRHGEPVNLAAHVQRFQSSAQLLGLPAPEAATWEKATAEAVGDFVRESGLDAAEVEAKCQWTYTRGRESTGVPSAWVTVRPIPQEQLDQRENGVRVMTAQRGYTLASGSDADAAPWLTVGAKSLNYAAAMAALRWAKQNGYDDVIYVDASGRVLEGATSSVLVVSGGKLRTPVTGGDVLPGTTQASVFTHAERDGWKCKEKDLTVADLRGADQVWLVSSVRGGVRVTTIDGEELPAPSKKDEKKLRQLIDAALATPATS
ncbi:aminodeoxychorismate lyase [Corynebacterium sp. CCUG 71335]|uniref:aminodeoxychorismate lyase n=1 Tax=unclassified Corynebacterium TaxID=2624378 RepID=UPI00210A96C8|nr:MULTISPECIES: aminodeoxychorismate lyase [unclassified Corynebacterium]MCQ4621634.1 aminodeoxychorismate lyase [Corynebacterium sp. CCUG 71335]MCQ4625422.1 aminodeoxychorismate lyase [Corynebacterium sp. CCUG 69979]